MRRIREELLARPRVALGHWPTPLERCERLGAGAEVWLKRDDCSGLAFGGNKTRKLEFLLGRAIAEGADRVVTFGALQSNHARQTAAACAKVGLACDLILTRAVRRDDDPYTGSGNVLLDRTLGATIHVVDDPEAAAVRFGELLAEAGEQRVFTIIPGGSDATGTLGYIDASFEIAAQCGSSDVSFDRIVVAASTGGTAAGLVLGTALAGLDAIVDVVCVYEPADVTAETIRSLVQATAAELKVDVPGDGRWTITDAELGDGYGIPTAAGLAAIRRLAEAEGVLLDPVYTSKAFAFLLADPRFDGTRTLFVHTGGGPGLFAYASALAEPPRSNSLMQREEAT